MNAGTAARRALVPAATVAACGALALRTPATLSLGVLVPVGLLGLAGGAPRLSPPVPGANRWGILFVGLGPFLLVRLFGPPLPAALTAMTVITTTAAAVAEEAFFRRFVYGWLATRGAATAVIGSAALFALIHVPIYGVGVVFIDFGAGLVFGYQRWASGGWSVPAATHAVANLAQLSWSW